MLYVIDDHDYASLLRRIIKHAVVFIRQRHIANSRLDYYPKVMNCVNDVCLNACFNIIDYLTLHRSFS